MKDPLHICAWEIQESPIDLGDLVQGTDGLFYTCDGTTGRVTQVDASGEVLGFFGEPGEGVGQLSTAHDIDYSPNSDIVVGHLDGRMQKFSRR